MQAIASDAAVPALPVLSDSSALRSVLAPFADACGLEKLKRTTARVISAHPGSRYTFAVRIETAGQSLEIIAKAYAVDRPDVHDAMELIWHAGFDHRAECSIPKPLAYIAPLRMVLQEKVDGPLAQGFFVSGNDEARRIAACRCARWLARFHSAAPVSGPVLCVREYLVALERWSRRIAKLGEAPGVKVFRLLRALEREASVVREAPVAGHGSFSPSQILFDSRRTVTFDWDGHDAADPARDVARFRMALARLAVGRLHSVRALDAAAADFMAEYLAAGGPAIERNLRFFEAATCLQLAKYNIAHPVARWREKLESMLDEGLRILEEQR